MEMIINLALILFAYLLGSVSSAIIVCRIMRLPDPRGEGSQNPGATNVLRFGGKRAAAITLAGDMLKGLLPVLLAQYLSADPLTLAGVGLAAFFGHLYPLYFHLEGGKGVATSLGVFLGFSWALGLAVIGTWLLMAALFRVSSLSALTAALLAPLYCAWLLPSVELVVAAGIMTAWLFWRHRSNIRNLISGAEDKIGSDVD